MFLIGVSFFEKSSAIKITNNGIGMSQYKAVFKLKLFTQNTKTNIIILDKIVNVILGLFLSFFAILRNSILSQTPDTKTKTKKVHSLISISADVIKTIRLPVTARLKKLFNFSVIFKFFAY